MLQCNKGVAAWWKLPNADFNGAGWQTPMPLDTAMARYISEYMPLMGLAATALRFR